MFNSGSQLGCSTGLDGCMVEKKSLESGISQETVRRFDSC